MTALLLALVLSQVDYAVAAKEASDETKKELAADISAVTDAGVPTAIIIKVVAGEPAPFSGAWLSDEALMSLDLSQRTLAAERDFWKDSAAKHQEQILKDRIRQATPTWVAYVAIGTVFALGFTAGALVF